MSKSKYYVTMNDKALSGWGHAENKINKLVIECDNMDEVETVMAIARSRDEMKYINYHHDSYPYYNPKKYLVSFKTKKDYPLWFDKEFLEKGGFQ